MPEGQDEHGLDSLAEQPGGQPGRSSPLLDTVRFAECYRVEAPKLVTFLVMLGADRHTAADITQDTMMLAYLRWSEIEAPRRWIRVVARNAFRREVGRHPERLIACVPDVHNDLDADLVLITVEQQQVVETLQVLPLAQREVMALTFDGFKPREIAEMLRADAKQVRANLYKARMSLSRVVSSAVATGEAEER